MQGCDYILHVASPFVINDDDSIIKTAVDGTLRVLRAAQQSSSVKKIVQTSSIVAINGFVLNSYFIFIIGWLSPCKLIVCGGY